MAEGKANTQTVGKWSSKVYKLSDFLERFQLPQIVKVHEGYHDESEEKTVGFDDVLILHKYETISKVFAISFQGGEECEEMSLPLTCAVKVDRVSEEFAKSSLSVGGILQQLSKVRFVRVAESDTEVGLTRNDKLKVKYKTVENHGSSFSFILSTLTKPKQVFTVTQNCKATFQAVLDPNEYRIAEVIRNFGLPIYVYMVDNGIQSKLRESFQPVQKVLKLQRTFTETFVIASTLGDPSSVIKLQENLEITLHSSVEAENKRQTNAEFCSEDSSNRVGNEEKTINKRADSRVVYEDMSYHAKETEIASLQKEQMKREIKKDSAGKLQVVIPNNYSPTPLVRALSNRNGIYDFPKATALQQTQESSHSHKTPLYDTPKGGISSQNDDRNTSVGLFKNQIYCQEYARMEWLKCPSVSSSAEDEESEDHIYQEITFRELPEEMKDSCSIGKEALIDTDIIIPSNKRKVPSKRDSTPANLIVGESKTEHLNTYQIDRTMNDRSRLTRKYQTRNAQTDSDQAVYENCNFLKARLGESDSDYEDYNHEAKTLPQRRATSTGVLSLKSSSLGSAISDSLLKNKLFAMKADGTGTKIPPQPPPRTSSRKPDIPEELECSKPVNASTKSKKKVSHAPLPEPPMAKPSVRRSASAAATFGILKEKKKFSDRPLPVPKTRCPSVNSTEVLTNKVPSTDTQASTSKASCEKPLRPRFKPLVPPKVVTPTVAAVKARVDGNEGQDRDFRERISNSLDLRKPARCPPKPKAYASSRNKSENELMEAEKKMNMTARANRSHSLNELDTTFDDTKFTIPEDLRSLGVAGVAECLKKLKLDKLVEYFQENQIDGDMLLSLDDDILCEMGVEKFHRLKLVKFIGGWRPMM